jgi:hypothetical protein
MELHPPKAPVPKKPRIELGNARGIALATTLATEPSPGALVGGISHAARTVAAQSLLRWRFAYWGRQLYPRSAAARRIAEAAGAQLKTDLKAALASADQPLAAALKRDIDDLEHVLKSIAAPTAGGVLARPHLSELTRLEVTALTGGFPGDEGDALRAAFRRWREVTVSYDMTNLETAGTALSSAIDGALTRQVRIAGKYKSPSIYRKSISSAVRTLSRSQPRGEAIDALRGVEAAISKSSDPALRKIWCEQILPALSSAPHLTGRLANVIDGITTIKATDKAALDSAVSRIKGVLAEMIATSVPAYRDALMEATRNADQLAASLNLRALRASGDAHAFVDRLSLLLK